MARPFFSGSHSPQEKRGETSRGPRHGNVPKSWNPEPKEQRPGAEDDTAKYNARVSRENNGPRR